MPPDFKLPQVKSGWSSSILASRGCELNRNFCSMQNIFGNFFLQRNTESVLGEIRGITTKYAFIVDDNFYGATSASQAHFNRVLDQLAKGKARWLTQARLAVLKGEGVLERFKKANCAGLLIGFESINPEARVPGKPRFDEDRPSTVERTLQFCRDVKMEMALFNVLAPFPGTSLYNDMEKEGRIISKNWDDYRTSKVVFRPKHFEPEELEKAVSDATKKFYSPLSIFQRLKFNMNYDVREMYLLPNVLKMLGFHFHTH